MQRQLTPPQVVATPRTAPPVPEHRCARCGSIEGSEADLWLAEDGAVCTTCHLEADTAALDGRLVAREGNVVAGGFWLLGLALSAVAVLAFGLGPLAVVGLAAATGSASVAAAQLYTRLPRAARVRMSVGFGLAAAAMLFVVRTGAGTAEPAMYLLVPFAGLVGLAMPVPTEEDWALRRDLEVRWVPMSVIALTGWLLLLLASAFGF